MKMKKFKEWISKPITFWTYLKWNAFCAAISITYALYVIAYFNGIFTEISDWFESVKERIF